MEEIIADCERIRSDIQQVNDASYGPLDNKYSQKSTKLPFVLLLGNHSSGKSTFANFLMGRTVQSTGVAPTDDGFTVICPHTDDLDRTGSALTADPELGFQSLSYFGPTLINLTKLKYRKGLKSKDFMIIDTPGMIDSPQVGSSHSIGSNGNYGHGYSTGNFSSKTISAPPVDVSRGYDFAGAVQWFAERADLILLFFDPDKPGTTGETLNILTSSLAGYDYKLRIILNKADQFLKIHDFARCYGSLCWNLSKVIRRKDLPPIYTMCVYPSTGVGGGSAEKQINTSTGNFDKHPLAAAVQDLLATRDEVIAEVHCTPRMRVDNEVSRLNSSLEQLVMHMKVVQEVSTQYKSYWWNWNIGIGVSSLFNIGLSTSVWYNVKQEYKLHAIGLGALACSTSLALTVYLRNRFLRHQAEWLTSRSSYKTIFQGLYGVVNNGSYTGSNITNSYSGGGMHAGGVNAIDTGDAGDSSITSDDNNNNSSRIMTNSPARTLHHYASATPHSNMHPNSSMMTMWHNVVLPHLLHAPVAHVLYANEHSNPKEKGLSTYFITNLVSDKDVQYLESLLEHNMSRLRKKANRLLVNKGQSSGAVTRTETVGSGNMSSSGLHSITHDIITSGGNNHELSDSRGLDKNTTDKVEVIALANDLSPISPSSAAPGLSPVAIAPAGFTSLAHLHHIGHTNTNTNTNSNSDHNSNNKQDGSRSSSFGTEESFSLMNESITL